MSLLYTPFKKLKSIFKNEPPACLDQQIIEMKMKVIDDIVEVYKKDFEAVLSHQLTPYSVKKALQDIVRVDAEIYEELTRGKSIAVFRVEVGNG